MNEHPALAFLTAALARAEETPQAATDGPWHVSPCTYGGSTSDWEIGAPSHTVVSHYRYEGGGISEEADAHHIALHDPAAVLRRIAADRQILDEHHNTNDGDCAVCVVGKWGYPTHGGCSPAPWPCRTVLLLAEGWGWEEQR